MRHSNLAGSKGIALIRTPLASFAIGYSTTEPLAVDCTAMVPIPELSVPRVATLIVGPVNVRSVSGDAIPAPLFFRGHPNDRFGGIPMSIEALWDRDGGRQDRISLAVPSQAPREETHSAHGHDPCFVSYVEGPKHRGPVGV